jgi:hypothetical protein
MRVNIRMSMLSSLVVRGSLALRHGLRHARREGTLGQY